VTVALSNAERQARWRKKRQDRDRRFVSIREQLEERHRTLSERLKADIAKNEAVWAERLKQQEAFAAEHEARTVDIEARAVKIAKGYEEAKKKLKDLERESELRTAELRKHEGFIERLLTDFRGLGAQNRKLRAENERLKAQAKRKAKRRSGADA
jgi:hypothetical protein